MIKINVLVAAFYLNSTNISQLKNKIFMIFLNMLEDSGFDLNLPNQTNTPMSDDHVPVHHITNTKNVRFFPEKRHKKT